MLLLWILVETWGGTPLLTKNLKELPGELPALMKQAEIPGFALGYFSPGEPDSLSALGFKNAQTGEALELSNTFEAASLSKPVFAYLCMRLVDQGILDLDQPLAKVLQNERMAHHPAFEKVTARILLSHRSGLPNWGGEKLDFKFDPDADFQYSGEGYVYLGMVVEKLTGKSLVNLFQTEVFNPLEMKSSTFTWQPSMDKSQAIAHDEWGVPVAKRNKVEKPNPAASLYTTLEDYMRFTKAILNGTGLKPDTYQTMLTPRGLVNFGDSQGQEQKVDLQWCLGWGQIMADGSPAYFHWGDNGEFKAWVMWRPAQKDGLVYFANSSEGHGLLEKIASTFHPDVARTAKVLGYEAYDAPGRAERRAGMRHVHSGEYDKALALFDLGLSKYPDSASLKTLRQWTHDLVSITKQPVVLEQSYQETIAGTYGPRTIKTATGQLFYQRTGGQLYPLIPLGNHFFALDGEFSFRIQIGMDSQGTPTKIIGHYLGGGQDETERGPEN